MDENELMLDENLVSFEDLDDVGEIIEREYRDIMEDDVEPEVDDLELWDRVDLRGDRYMLDRETLMDVFGENEYETF